MHRRIGPKTRYYAVPFELVYKARQWNVPIARATPACLMDYLFPDRVGKKYKVKYALPIGGEFVVDIDRQLASVFKGLPRL